MTTPPTPSDNCAMVDPTTDEWCPEPVAYVVTLTTGGAFRLCAGCTAFARAYVLVARVEQVTR